MELFYPSQSKKMHAIFILGPFCPFALYMMTQCFFSPHQLSKTILQRAKNKTILDELKQAKYVFSVNYTKATTHWKILF